MPLKQDINLKIKFGVPKITPALDGGLPVLIIIYEANRGCLSGFSLKY